MKPLVVAKLHGLDARTRVQVRLPRLLRLFKFKFRGQVGVGRDHNRDAKTFGSLLSHTTGD